MTKKIEVIKIGDYDCIVGEDYCTKIPDYSGSSGLMISLNATPGMWGYEELCHYDPEEILPNIEDELEKRHADYKFSLVESIKQKGVENFFYLTITHKNKERT